jgi:hypothetical protein
MGELERIYARRHTTRDTEVTPDFGVIALVTSPTLIVHLLCVRTFPTRRYWIIAVAFVYVAGEEVTEE